MLNSSTEELPKHIAIIMDGNGRWAQSRGLARLEGHQAGVENLRNILEASQELGIQYLTVYAFSTENWQRPADEVQGLFKLLELFLEKERDSLIENRIQLKAIGNYRAFPATVVKLLESIIKETEEFDKLTLTIALNYSSRSEVVYAAKRYAQLVKNGQEDPIRLTWEKYSEFMYTHETPDPDLIIRTSGENRLSNFLLLQGAYAEFVAHKNCWPDFDRDSYIECINIYNERERRFGKTSEQVLSETTSSRKILA